MLQQLIPELSFRKVILASTSPRRKDLLNQLGLNFSVIPSDFKEDLDKSVYVGRPWAYVEENARLKALDVFSKLKKDLSSLVIIGCDTVVTLDGAIIEKPKDKKDAVRILSCLSDREHSVYSGLAIVCTQNEAEPKILIGHEESRVQFAKLSPTIIDAYVATGEPLDKAGAYGIQGKGCLLVEKISGDYSNIVGLPIPLLRRQLLTCFMSQ